MSNKLKDTITDEEFDPDDLPLRVCQSAAGYYIGRLEPSGCPYDRVSGYFKYRSNAEFLLAMELMKAKT